MATLTYEEYDCNSVEQAKRTVIELTKAGAPTNTVDIFNSHNLEEIENGIRQLNEFSSKCWILSALALYTLVYDKNLYEQSGLDWITYQRQAKQRLGLDPRDVSEQLSGAKFFIANRVRLINAGWTTAVPNQSLARGLMAYGLSGDLDATIEHMIHDTQKGFREWYQSFRAIPATTADARPDIVITKTGVKINGIDAVRVSDALPVNEKAKINHYLEQIFTALKNGEVPAIVPVYDETEAKNLINLRDRYRQKK